MFKHKIYKTIILAAIAISACSCNKYLELNPQDGITRDKFWKTKEQVLAAIVGCYNGVIVGYTARSPVESMFIWGELRADFVIPGTGITPDENNIVSANILPTNSINNWASFYREINLCNTVLDYAPGVKDIDNTLSQAQLNSYLAEALTLRALMYFYLVRTFGDVPLKTKSTASDSDITQIAKSTQKEVLAQIVADLKLAEGYATVTYGDNASDKGRITKWTVNALQADVALWMDNYADCITACDKIISSGKFGLVNGDNAWFANLYVNGNSNESILEMQYDFQSLNPFFPMFQTGRPRYSANPDIIDNFYTLDPLDDTNRDLRGVDVAIHVADQSIYKYYVASTDVSYRHWIVYRYADVLLMKAEAQINSNKGAEALEIINTIRTRARALATSASTPSSTDVAGLTDYLLAERAREFAFEGKRWFDLLRNAKRNNFARLDVLIKATLAVVPPLVQQSALNKLKDPNSLFLPIYQTEIQNDPNLVQNPFYK